MKTIKTILDEMKDTVSQGLVKSPSWWVDRSIELSALWQELKDYLTISEINYLNVVNRIQEEKDCSQAKAVTLAKIDKELNEKGLTHYQYFKYLEGRDKIIKEFILLAKRRATIDGFNL